MSVWTILLQSAAPVSVLIAVFTFVYNEKVRRQKERESSIKGIMFEPIGGWAQLVLSKNEVIDKTIVTISAYGPGKRDDPACLLWINNQWVQAQSAQIDHLSGTSEPLVISIRAKRTDPRTRDLIHVGLTWTVPFGNGFRQEYVRINVNELIIEEWQWKKLYTLRSWLAKHRKRKGKPMGKWKPRQSKPLPDWIGPTKPEARRPQGGIELIE